MLNTISPSIPQVPFVGVGGYRGSNIQKSGNLPNGWTDWPIIWFTSVDSYGNAHRLKTIAPRYPKGLSPRHPKWRGHPSFIKSLRNAMICTEKIKINDKKIKCTN